MQILKSMIDEFHFAASLSVSWHYACWLTLSWLHGAVEQNSAFINVRVNTCAFTTLKNRNVVCEKGLCQYIFPAEIIR